MRNHRPALLLLLVLGCAETVPLPPQPVARTEGVVEKIHGVDVADPYRWLENGKDSEVVAWADAQDAHTRAALENFPRRAEIRARIEVLNSIGRIRKPLLRKTRVFYEKRTGLQEQYVLVARDGFTGEPKTVLDPNTLSADGTVALDWWHPSRDGTLLAYGTSEGGSELSTLRVLDIGPGKKRNFTEEIPNCRAAAVAWRSDNSGFYYTRYPAPGTVPPGEEQYNRKIFFHELGTDFKDDPQVFPDRPQKEDWPHVSLSPDDRTLLVHVFQGWSKSEIYLKDLQDPAAKWIPVVEGVEASSSAVVVGERLYIYTDEGAPMHRVMVADTSAPQRKNWKELIPESDSNLEDFVIVGGKIVTKVLEKASTRLKFFALDGTLGGEIALPTLGTVGELSGEPDGEDLVFDFQSFFTAPRLSRFSLKTGVLEEFERIEANIDAAAFEAKQVWVRSKDGTRISMFIIHARGLQPSGTSPTLLYGYGGFNNSITPFFSGSLAMWLEQGGILAAPNLRGGGEYGEAWHQAGMLGNKQNTFDDFIAAAEWLIENRYTNRDRLAIIGGSNGGLLVGAVLTQRPELFRAAVCSVPLLDMVRYPKFLIARLWIPEYGDPDKPEDFRWLRAYSPYHHVREGTAYPAVLLMTADTDTRVDPCHARKMAARLQAATSSDHPIFLHVERKAGHGAGKPLSKVNESLTDRYCFLMEQLRMK